ncbi:hypothetical protein CFAM422_009276 [Trichoderma lentiforme]|uniref:SGNH hydrolase-type esterase domain-containing protein n=1 Tax=Trichoderma lentiforme TaxID=1567552 RepID=A0A9P4XAD4_9HYPO|nr:hypothetical protein CFAM422_009276 [Trichoderma lentiforme]
MSVIRILGLLLSFCLAANAVVSPTSNPSIMVVGDSISQGRNGDFTWRYRLWEWFNSNGVSVNFVGPYTGTVQQDTAQPATPPTPYGQNTTQEGSGPVRQLGGYNSGIPSNSGFLNGGNRHFAAWGRQIAQDMSLIQSMVSQYQPDYILLELGFNDLGWFVSDALGTIQSMTTFIQNARAAKADIAFAVANIPQRLFIGGRNDLITKTDDYNALLPALLQDLSTSESPIQLVQFRENYSCEPDGCPAGSDGLHPNALGEFQIAKAFANALSQGFNWPGNAFIINGTIPTRACSTPSNVVAKATTCGVTVTWDPVDGAYGYIVTSGFNGAVSSVLNVTQPTYSTTWTAAGIEWFYQIQAFCSDVRSGISDQVTATANPTCAPGPSNIIVKSTADGIDMTWDAVEGYDVDIYGAIYYDQTSQDFLEDYGWSGTSASYHGMNPGDRVEAAVETWATVDGVLCAGLPATGGGAIVGGIVPSAPTGLKVATINEGATVQLTFNSDPNAFSYGFYTHSLMEPNQPYVLGGYTSDVPCIGVTFLFPGAWNYEFCVVAYNGNSSSPMSECVQGPQDITEVSDCPVLVVPTPDPNPTPTVTWSIPGASGTASGKPPGSSSSGAVVYIDPTIWDSPTPTAACEPPCTLVLPPWTLSSMTTITIPVVTETIEETWPKTTTGVVTYLTTTITVFITLPPITTSVIDVSNIILTTSTSEIVPVRSSIVVPPVVITEPTHGITYTYKPGPFPTGIDVGPPPPGHPGNIHISAGIPGPICLLGCGHICLFNCGGGSSGGGGDGSHGCIGPGCGPGSEDDCVGEGCEDEETSKTTTTTTSKTSKSSTEDCASETNTECHQVCTTKPCATVCNTYLGCDCTTSSVTDYWVSCQTQSCTTTSSDVITGCFLTATATTTGSYCPLVTIDPTTDDEGDDVNLFGNWGPTFTVTYPESVIVQQTPYPVISGYVTVAQTAYPIPNVESLSTTSLDGTRAVVYPSFVGLTVSVTLTQFVLSTFSNPPATTTWSPSKSSSTPTSTSSTPYPTNTNINEGNAYCFDGLDDYVSFSLDEAETAIESLCSAGYTLEPDDEFGYVTAYDGFDYNVYVSIGWAPDQTNCGDEQPFPLADNEVDSELCLAAWSTDFYCTNETGTQTTSYGGAYVLKPPKTGGCILLSLYGYSKSEQPLISKPSKHPFIPPVANVTHKGDKFSWKHDNKTGDHQIWPFSRSKSSNNRAQLFSQEEINQLFDSSSNAT